MQIKVLKFGGTSLSSAEQFKKVKRIVEAEEERKYVVASAPGARFKNDDKVTDILYRCYDLLSENRDLNDEFSKIEKRFLEIEKDLQLKANMSEELYKIRNMFSKNIKKDYLASRGEYLNSILLAKYLGYDFIDASEVIFFDKYHKFDSEKTNTILSDVLKKHKNAVIPGFYGIEVNGDIKTFSRGGSDITGSIVARAANADIYENWTDVSGFLMADPRCVERPKIINELTYNELRELSYRGATVLHEDAVFPVKTARIPINIRNTNKPDDRGTIITPFSSINSRRKTVITGIAGKKGYYLLYIKKSSMNSEKGLKESILSCLRENEVYFEHISSSTDAITVIAKQEDFEGKKAKILNDIYCNFSPEIIIIEENIALIAVVSESGCKGEEILYKVLKSILEISLKTNIIDKGSNDSSIIIGIKEVDYEKAINVIYREFIKEKK